jgi:hypothetical protein
VLFADFSVERENSQLSDPNDRETERDEPDRGRSARWN